MDIEKIPVSERPLSGEFIILTSKSSGPGGQHVNKTETRVELRLHIAHSIFLTEEEKGVIHENLKNRISNEGFLTITAQKYRSQLKNRELAEKKLFDIITKALQKRKPRIATKPSFKAKEKRLQTKKIRSEKKTGRTKVKADTE
jgi:ribosome-associated protein